MDTQEEKLKKFEAMFADKREPLYEYPCKLPEEVYHSLSTALLKRDDLERQMEHLNGQIEKLDGLLPADAIDFAGNDEHAPEDLICPCCGSNNLHPVGTIEGSDENIRSEYAAYTQMNFWCECCPNIVGLRFRFHKGITCMTWQINDETTGRPDTRLKPSEY